MRAIWGKNLRNEKNLTLAFITKIEKKQQLKMKLHALNAYRVMINGQFVFYGPIRTAHDYIRLAEIDLDNYCTKSINTIVVEVVANNVNNFYYNDELPYFACEILEKDNIMVTTADFSSYLVSDRIQKTQRFSFQRTFTEAYKMNCSRNDFYNGNTNMFNKIETVFVQANQILDRKQKVNKFEIIRLSNIVENGSVSIDNNKTKWDFKTLHKTKEYNCYDISELEVNLSAEADSFCFKKINSIGERLSKNQYCIYDLSRTYTGFINLKLTVKEKASIYVIWDEISTLDENKCMKISYNRNYCCNVIKLELNEDFYDFISFECLTARYIKIICLDGFVTINAAELIKYENPNMYKLLFESNDNKLNKIVNAAQNTLSQNSVDIFMDCPSRERAGWLCDSFFEARAEKLMSGTNEIEYNFLENYQLFKSSKYLPDHMIPMCYPGDFPDKIFIPNWSMWYVLQLKDYFVRTNDELMIILSKEKVYGLLQYFQNFENEYGLLENLEGWVFLEWSKANDEDYIKGVNFPSNMIYSKMLNDVYELYGDQSCLKKSQSIKKTILNLSFNGEFFIDNAIRFDKKLVVTSNKSETCQYYAMFCDIIDSKGQPEFYQKMFDEFNPKRDELKCYSHVAKSNCFIGNYLRFIELVNENRYNQVLDECKDLFYNMAITTGTLWENSFIEGSLNHGFASIAANFIIEAISGFKYIDEKNKVVFIKKINPEYIFSIDIPHNDVYIHIKSDGFKINYQKPENYTLHLLS